MPMTYRWVPMRSSIALLTGVQAYARPADVEDWGPWGMHMMWGSWSLGMMIMMFLFWAVIIVGIVFLIRWLVTAGHTRQPVRTEPGSESALDS
jgi:uncharacterized membrane protein